MKIEFTFKNDLTETQKNDLIGLLECLPDIDSFQIRDSDMEIAGKFSPSLLISSLQSKNIISQTVGINNSAVSLLYHKERNIFGRVNIFQETDKNPTTTISSRLEILIDGLSPNQTLSLSIHSSGDISNNGENVGEIYGDNHKGLGVLNSDEKGQMRSIIDIKLYPLQRLWGRSICLNDLNEKGDEKKIVVGVIARCAEVGENSKRICECNGSTLWEDRSDDTKWTKVCGSVM